MSGAKPISLSYKYFRMTYFVTVTSGILFDADIWPNFKINIYLGHFCKFFFLYFISLSSQNSLGNKVIISSTKILAFVIRNQNNHLKRNKLKRRKSGTKLILHVHMRVGCNPHCPSDPLSNYTQHFLTHRHKNKKQKVINQFAISSF